MRRLLLFNPPSPADIRFYPYNLGKEVGYLGWLGNREFDQAAIELTTDVTDWERLMLRTINGTAVSADFSEYSVVDSVSSLSCISA